jgi:hypothetical protein
MSLYIVDLYSSVNKSYLICINMADSLNDTIHFTLDVCIERLGIVLS